MSKRVNQDDRHYDARPSRFGWCRDFGPEDFNGKNVVVRMGGGAVIRGTLTCEGTVDERGDGFAIIDAGTPVPIRKDMAAEFLSSCAPRTPSTEENGTTFQRKERSCQNE